MENSGETPPKIDDDAVVDPGLEIDQPSATLERPETAMGRPKYASSKNTLEAYAKDWRHFTSWCRRHGFEPLPPDPKVIGVYIGACAVGDTKHRVSALAISTIERRLSGLAWNFTERGFTFNRTDRHISSIVAVIRTKYPKPLLQKEGVCGDDIKKMVDSLGHDLRGVRDRAILLLGFAGRLRRSEIVGLDVVRDDRSDGKGWIEFFPGQGVLVTLRGKTWREVEVGRGASDQTCPVAALESWIRFGRIANGPLFRRIFKGNKTVDVRRLSDKHVARLVKRSALAAGVRSDLPEGERAELFSGYSLRAGLLSSLDVEQHYVQEQLDHTSAEITRKHQRRRDRFRTNLTKASGL